MYSEKVLDHFRNPRNMGEIPDADGVGTVGNPVCVEPRALVYTNDGVVEIRNIVKNYKVLTHDGKYHVVNRVHSRQYTGKLCSIIAHNLGKTLVTPDHNILALKMSKIPHKFRSYRKFIADWYSADELEKGDVLLYPIPKEAEDIESIRLEIKKLKWDYSSKDLPEEVDVNNNFLRLMGYYLVEGYTRTERSKGTLGFVFSSKETNHINDVISLMKEIFRLAPSEISHRHNTTSLTYHSAPLARFFEKSFGKMAENKHIPDWALKLPVEKQSGLLCGLWKGDGYIKSHVAKYATTSRQLAYQIRTLLLRQKIIFSFLIQPQKGIRKESFHIYVKDDSSLKKLADIVGVDVVLPRKTKNPHRSWYDDDYYYTTIWKIDCVDYNGLVFNLEVDGSHSFVSSSATLHNCGDLMTVYIKIKDNRIEDIKFKTFGCGAAIATSSMVTELAKGKTIDEALKISRADVADALGGLPPIKMHCSNLAADALHEAVKDFFKKKEGKN